MTWNPLKIFPRKCLGIDIGTSNIRIVELNKFGKKIKLENYGEVEASAFYKKSFRTTSPNINGSGVGTSPDQGLSPNEKSLILSDKDIARAILALCQSAGIKTKKAIFSIPDFSSFFTWFALPPMTKEEVPSAIRYEAQQHIPLPLSEVTLDWQVISGKLSKQKKQRTKILLVAVPKEALNQYQEITALTQLELVAVEAEVFALSRSVTKKDKKVVALLDIGAQTSTISIVDQGILKRSHTIDISGNQLTKVISNSLGIEYLQAQNLKEKYGINPISQFLEPNIPYGQDFRKILEPLINLMISELERVAQEFHEAESKDIEEIVLAGGGAILPGLTDYFLQKTGKKTELADPFYDLFYPPILEKKLKVMGPSFAIAIGAALRGLE